MSNIAGFDRDILQVRIAPESVLADRGNVFADRNLLEVLISCK